MSSIYKMLKTEETEKKTKELLLHIIKGSEEAFAQIYNENSAQLFRMMLRLTGNADDAEELCQETWIRVIKGAANFKGLSTLKTWIYKIGLNLFRTQFKKKDKMNLIQIDNYREDPYTVNPGSEMEKDENLSMLSNDRRSQLSELIEYLHDKEKKHLHRAIRFTQKRLLSIDVRVKRKDEQ